MRSCFRQSVCEGDACLTWGERKSYRLYLEEEEIFDKSGTSFIQNGLDVLVLNAHWTNYSHRPDYRKTSIPTIGATYKSGLCRFRWCRNRRAGTDTCVIRLTLKLDRDTSSIWLKTETLRGIKSPMSMMAARGRAELPRHFPESRPSLKILAFPSASSQLFRSSSGVLCNSPTQSRISCC